MAGLMTAAMVLIELVVMRGMYRSRLLNAVLLAISVAALAGVWGLIRSQGAVGDTQFLRSMIPHHAAAVLMCEKAGVQNPEIAALCRTIVDSQQAEIRQMQEKLAELKGSS